MDVQQRARRRQRRRAAAMVGVCAMVVLGGAGVLALRHDHTPLAITAGDGSAPPATTIACLEVVPTTMPALAPTLTTNVDFGQATTTSYGPIVDPSLPPGVSTTTVDPRTVVPAFLPGESTTTTYPSTVVPTFETLPPFAGNPCSAPNSQWRCQGPMSTTSDGWSYFQYCEQTFAGDASTVPYTTAPTSFDPASTTDPFTTYPTGEIVTATTGAGTASTIPAP
jgi:hypothetical protein